MAFNKKNDDDDESQLDDIQTSTSLALSDDDFNRILMDVAPHLDTFLSPQSFGVEYLQGSPEKESEAQYYIS